MSKKTGKIILATALIGAAAAGTYYYLKKKKEAESFDFDYENGEDTATATKRKYVPLDFEKAGEKVNIFVSKAGDVLEKTVDMVKQKVGATGAGAVEEYLDEDDDDLDLEPLDLDDEAVETPVEVVEDILADDTDTQ